MRKLIIAFGICTSKKSQAEVEKPTPFMSKLVTGKGSHTFDPPGESGIDNDWVLVLKQN